MPAAWNCVRFTRRLRGLNMFAFKSGNTGMVVGENFNAEVYLIVARWNFREICIPTI